MPAPRILDFGPNPMAQAAARFGEGFSQGTNDRIERDALKDLMSRINPQENPMDAIQQIFGSRLPFEQKQKVSSGITDVLEKATKIKQEQIRVAKIGETKKKLLKAGLPEPLADLYSEATVGGQTELVRYLREHADRGGEDYLSRLIQESEKSPDLISQGPLQEVEALEQSPKIDQMSLPSQPQTKPQRKISDKGLTPKELVDRQEKRYTTQTPLQQQITKEIETLDSESRSIDLLNQLNDSKALERKPLSRLNRNPFTGDIIIPALASPEEQLFAKTINDFTVRAKESFGARVTNFDLERFMARLPTLANSEEGRKLILREMSIIDQLNKLDKTATRDVIDEYGIRNIDWTDAQLLARKKTETEKERLKKEYFDIDSVLNREEMEKIAKAKKQTPSDKVLMRTPEGQIKRFPKKNLPTLLDEGYEKL